MSPGIAASKGNNVFELIRIDLTHCRNVANTVSTIILIRYTKSANICFASYCSPLTRGQLAYIVTAVAAPMRIDKTKSVWRVKCEMAITCVLHHIM